MPRDIEQDLRRSLQARAADVNPDPALFARVQERIRRRRTLRVAVAGVATMLAVAMVAVAAPRLVDRRIEFEPAPVATQPPGASETPAEPGGPVGAPPPLVYTDGVGTRVFTEAGESPIFGGPGDESGAGAVTVRPGGRPQDVVAVVVLGQGCGRLAWTQLDATAAEPEQRAGDHFADDTCPRSAAFSPDGEHLAWVGQAGPDGDWMLHTVDWTDNGPGDDDASFGLDLGVEVDVRLEDWSWFSGSPTSEWGDLYFQVTDEERTTVLRRRIERQGDGALALPPANSTVDLELGAYTPVGGGMPGYTAVAFSMGGEGGPADELLLEVLVKEGDVTAGHIERGTEEYLDLPDTFLADLEPEALTDVWLSAAGDDVVFGDGAGTALTASWDEADPPVVALDLDMVHADLITATETSEQPTEPARSVSEVDVFFGMTGAEACVADQPVGRQVEGAGVARAALDQLLAGPTPQESNGGIETPFSANTAGALNDITIVEGEARVDLRDFSADVGTDACTKSAILDSLDKTLRQFPTVDSSRYSFDGDAQAFQDWIGSSAEAVPPAVARTAEAIRAAAEARDWTALRRLSAETSCTLSDQREPCVPHWRDQEANGEDPMGTLVDLLSEPATRDSNAPMWVWPPQWAQPGVDYAGPRIGIDPDGIWRYYVQSGG